MNFYTFLLNFNWFGFFLGSLVAGLLLAFAHLVPRSREAKKATELLVNYPGYMAVNEYGLLIRYTYGTVSLIIGLTIFALLSGTLVTVLPFIGVAVVAGAIRVIVGFVIGFVSERHSDKDKVERLENGRSDLTQ